MHSKEKRQPIKQSLTKVTLKLVSLLIVVLLFFISYLWLGQNSIIKNSVALEKNAKSDLNLNQNKSKANNNWIAPNEQTIPNNNYGQMIRYGKELIVHTSRYFGPNGSISKLSNGMNCQNCHLEAGTKIFANNYSDFFASYPKINNRSGKNDPVEQRIADCFERSLNGKAPNLKGKEVKAMLTYMKWLGSGVKSGDTIVGKATEKITYLDRAASPQKGKLIYAEKCVSCHGVNGEGLMAPDEKEYIYPPLWGKNSYNDGAGLYRLSNFAGFVKNNMPLGTKYPNAQLSNEEAWDLAAFVNTQDRPHKNPKSDYPNLIKKPIDAPFSPYADKYTAKQHKLGPFKPIAEFYNK